MAINYISIGQKIKATRKKKGLSQLKLAELVNLSPTHISYIENGSRSMSLEVLVLLVNALEATADEILMDSLENTIKVSNHKFAALLSDCSDYECRILHDMTTTLKASLRENVSAK